MKNYNLQLPTELDSSNAIEIESMTDGNINLTGTNDKGETTSVWIGFRIVGIEIKPNLIMFDGGNWMHLDYLQFLNDYCIDVLQKHDSKIWELINEETFRNEEHDEHEAGCRKAHRIMEDKV